jgi:hypothetical protein
MSTTVVARVCVPDVAGGHIVAVVILGKPDYQSRITVGAELRRFLHRGHTESVRGLRNLVTFLLQEQKPCSPAASTSGIHNQYAKWCGAPDSSLEKAPAGRQSCRPILETAAGSVTIEPRVRTARVP